MSRRWVAGVGVALAAWAGAARAGDSGWSPVSATAARARPAASLGRPVPMASLGSPARAAPEPALTRTSHSQGPIIRAQAPDVPPPGAPGPVPGGPPAGGFVAPDAPGLPPVGDERYNNGVVIDAPPAKGKGFGFLGGLCDRLGAGGGVFGFQGGAGRCRFESDHCFDNFVSPVTNPFLFEDPRSLTEVRPIFIYQAAPSGNPFFRGGDLEFFGLQARIALTERLSFVVNKLGFVALQPNNDVGEFDDNSGFAEVWLGPKYTFLRNDLSGTLGAVGLTFQVPAGPSKVFQDTGDLSLVPYVSFGQNFGRTSFGSFNALATFAYAFGTDNKRTDYFSTSLHLDYDVANLHKIYPLVELNWFSFTQSGKVRDLNFEGSDVINFGSRSVSGNDIVTVATGVRYKFSEATQFGLATEWPVTGRKDLSDFRLTLDLIFRY